MYRHFLARNINLQLALSLVLLAGVLAFSTPTLTATATASAAAAPAAAAKYPEGSCRKVGGATHRTIQRGNTGKSVKHAQCLLNKYWGFNLKVDGVFGKRTEDAVEYVQDYALNNTDGIVGRCTWPVLHLSLPPNGC